MRFSDQLLEDGSELWEAQKDHPFVTELADGTLDDPAFRHWLEQDYRYLLDWARAFAIAGARADDEETMTALLSIAHSTLSEEMSLHREFAAEYGIERAELEQVRKAPTCEAYTSFLIRTAYEGSTAELVAALYPCGQGVPGRRRVRRRTGRRRTPVHPLDRDVHWRGVPGGRRPAAGRRRHVRRALPRPARSHARGVPDQRSPGVRVLGDGLYAGGVVRVTGPTAQLTCAAFPGDWDTHGTSGGDRSW